jgi:glycosyltransferase involved in cell wall biosynthesis
MPERFVVGWKLATLSLQIASVRYRGLLPILELDHRGIENRIFSIPVSSQLEGLGCLVIVKSFSPDDLVLASEARRRGIPVIVDLCDNIFIDGYGNKGGVISSRPTLIFEQIARLASVVVTTTEPLADVLRSRVPDNCVVRVIPDGIETDDLVEAMSKRLADVRRAERHNTFQRMLKQIATLKHKVRHLQTAELGPAISHIARIAVETTWNGVLRRRAQTSAAKPAVREPIEEHLPVSALPADQARQRIVWFGHHGADYAQFGMLDLVLVKDDLEVIARGFDVELVVVSNNVVKFNSHIRPFRMRTRYVEWSNASLLLELKGADVVIIPNSLDEFSVCKSSNRAVLALLSGVPVVATRTPALEALTSVIALDGGRAGLAAYLVDTERRREDVERGQLLIESLYGARVIGDLWCTVIDEAIARGVPVAPATEVAVVVQMALDWVLLRPLVAEMRRRGRSIIAVLNAELQKDLASITSELDALGVQMIAVGPAGLGAYHFPDGVRVLLAASESSLLPHRFAHSLCRVANSKGVITATLQHGYETPGLTYDDPLQSARKIRFASKRIYLWGSRSSLCPQVRRATLEKCVSVGCPDIIGPPSHVVRRPEGDTRRVIGIFENLHWHRYPEAYRHFFVKGIRALTRRFPEISFVVHTHPAGRWLDNSSRRKLVEAPNVTIAKLGGEMREILPCLDAVISSPSSVAIHAARFGLPVAVVTSGIDAARYNGLFGIETLEHWIEYVQQVVEPGGHATLAALSRQFADQVIQPGDAATRIVDDLFSRV